MRANGVHVPELREPESHHLVGEENEWTGKGGAYQVLEERGRWVLYAEVLSRRGKRPIEGSEEGDKDDIRCQAWANN